jgi:hypothetical protein
MSRTVLPVVLSAMLSVGSMPIALAASEPQLNFKIYSPEPAANASATPATPGAAQSDATDPTGTSDMAGTGGENATASTPMPKADNSLLAAPIPEIKTTNTIESAGGAGESTDNSNIVDSVLKNNNEHLRSETPVEATTPKTTEASPAQPEPAMPAVSDETKTDASSTSSAMPSAAAGETASTTENTAATAASESQETTTANTEKATTTADGSKPLQGYIRVVPTGTKIPIIMDTAVDSETSQEGDEFSARTAEDLTIDGATVVPAGSIIKGRIAQLNAPKHLNRGGSVALKFDTVTTPDNRQIPLVANLVKRGGVVHARRGLQDVAFDTGTVALPLLLGLGIGYVAGNNNNNNNSSTSTSSSSSNNHIGKGEAAAIGAAIGLAVGVAILCAKKGKKVDVRPGDELKIELAEDLRMPVM